MPFSHHSHSGQFCAHAKDQLEEMVQTAISRKMKVYALTEHMPRDLIDRYPEEENDIPDLETFHEITKNFYNEAQRLREKYKDQITILLGFESEWIRPSSLELIQNLQKEYKWDVFVGSVHHVHTIPIDFDKTHYEKARNEAGGSDERLFQDYFDSQYEMLKAIRPPVVGHFDLIRLLSDEPNKNMNEYNGVWEKVLRNLEFIKSYDGALEINSSALRKGMKEPYPSILICKTFRDIGGSFVLSDDAHSMDQVALNYQKVLKAIDASGIEQLVYFEPLTSNGLGSNKSCISIAELRNHSIWSA